MARGDRQRFTRWRGDPAGRIEAPIPDPHEPSGAGRPATSPLRASGTISPGGRSRPRGDCRRVQRDESARITPAGLRHRFRTSATRHNSFAEHARRWPGTHGGRDCVIVHFCHRGKGGNRRAVENFSDSGASWEEIEVALFGILGHGSGSPFSSWLFPLFSHFGKNRPLAEGRKSL
jgi:hypothetical protein